MDPEVIEMRLREFLAANAEREGIAAAYLFGSVARGTAGPGSDVDVGILYRENPPPTLAGMGFRLEGDLESLLGMPVQVVVLNHTPVDLAIRVLRDGKLLVDSNRSKRVDFEVTDALRVLRSGTLPEDVPQDGIGGRVTDLQLVAKKLALIETCVGELRTLVRLEVVRDDVRELRFAAYTLHIAIQAALDVAAHIVADNRLGRGTKQPGVL